MQEQDGHIARAGLFSRWGARLAQAVMREPSVVLLERNSDDVRDRNNSVSNPRVETAN